MDNVFQFIACIHVLATNRIYKTRNRFRAKKKVIGIEGAALCLSLSSSQSPPHILLCFFFFAAVDCVVRVVVVVIACVCKHRCEMGTKLNFRLPICPNQNMHTTHDTKKKSAFIRAHWLLAIEANKPNETNVISRRFSGVAFFWGKFNKCGFSFICQYKFRFQFSIHKTHINTPFCVA